MEIELKIKASHDDIKSKLGQHDAEEIRDIHQVDRYFNAPDRDFAETDEALRIREMNNEYYLTYKGPKLDNETKSRKELETGIKNDGVMTSILQELGFSEVLKVEKDRVCYRLNDVYVFLDHVKGLGEYIEVEVIDKETPLETGKQKIKKQARKLGLDPAKSIQKSYMELILEDQKDN